jgi:hypothetical protein
MIQVGYVEFMSDKVLIIPFRSGITRGLYVLFQVLSRLRFSALMACHGLQTVIPQYTDRPPQAGFLMNSADHVMSKLIQSLTLAYGGI